jgi:hypothetical protein
MTAISQVQEYIHEYGYSKLMNIFTWIWPQSGLWGHYEHDHSQICEHNMNIISQVCKNNLNTTGTVSQVYDEGLWWNMNMITVKFCEHKNKHNHCQVYEDNMNTMTVMQVYEENVNMIAVSHEHGQTYENNMTVIQVRSVSTKHEHCQFMINK